MSGIPQPVAAESALPGVVRSPTIRNSLIEYCYSVIWCADVTLANSFSTLFQEIVNSLEVFTTDFTDDIA